MIHFAFSVESVFPEFYNHEDLTFVKLKLCQLNKFINIFTLFAYLSNVNYEFFVFNCFEL